MNWMRKWSYVKMLRLFSKGTIHKRCWQFFRIFDTPHSNSHVSSFLVLSFGNFDQFLTPPNCQRHLWTDGPIVPESNIIWLPKSAWTIFSSKFWTWIIFSHIFTEYSYYKFLIFSWYQRKIITRIKKDFGSIYRPLKRKPTKAPFGTNMKNYFHIFIHSFFYLVLLYDSKSQLFFPIWILIFLMY